ncbi:biotin--[acetyl-CoA-carboxylase] ligase [Lacticaseibacillus mingshuiensis]|uniref:Biotin--[acetyl-CoA-carboxylase] ligase n=1 Tax=Lacticaseibacillus mingshuiensis TaxID=2799574 RepID=A0ABW4CEG7_9LACO|nr:biotin--[acetyl-CoA-carboxylase] ligase [Lacticaseibacillus mingshuiensis]
MFSAHQVTAALPPHLKTLPILTYETVGSTNQVAAALLASGRLAPFVLTANGQTAGIGRSGHNFLSPKKSGLYLTVTIPLADWQPAPTQLTPAAGVALCQTITAMTGQTPRLKWVNDVLLDDAKIAGILAQLVPAPTPTVVLGVGINLAPLATQPESTVPAGSLFTALPASDLRPILAANWLAALANLNQPDAAILPAYRKRAAWVGRQVILTTGTVQTAGVLTGFADDGQLLLTTAQGLRSFADGTLRLG